MPSQELHVIVGLGATGLSCAHYLIQQGLSVAVTDSRTKPPHLAEFKSNFPNVPVSVGQLDEALLAKATRVILSPGVALQEPAIAHQIARGVQVIGDVELFARQVKAPVIAITGTNAKSTVTTLVGEMALAAHVKAQIGGNLGVPALDLLALPDAELFVLENRLL